MSTTPAGWYDDGQGAVRWWDGNQWTENVHTPSAPAVSSAPSVPTPAQPIQNAAAEMAPGGATEAADSAVPSIPLASANTGLHSDVASATAGYAAPSVTATPAQPGYTPGAGYTPPAADMAVSATAPRRAKSRLWIPFTILGILVVLTGVFTIIGIATFFSALTTVAPAASGARTSLITYNQAWVTADCDQFESSTSSTFREKVGLTGCDEFTTEAAKVNAAYVNYTQSIQDLFYQNGGVYAETVETYTDAATGDTVNTRWNYVLRPASGGSRDWVVDRAEDTTNLSR